MHFFALLGVGLIIAVVLTLVILRRNLFRACTISFLEVFGALALRSLGVTMHGQVDIDLFLIKASGLAVDIGAESFGFYLALTLAFFGCMFSLGGYYADKRAAGA